MTSSPVQTHQFDSRDPAAIQEFLSTVYDPKLRIQSRNGYRLTHHRVDTGPFAIATTRQTGHLEIDASTLGGLVIGRTRTAHVDRSCAGSADRFGPGEHPPRHQAARSRAPSGGIPARWNSAYWTCRC